MMRRTNGIAERCFGVTMDPGTSAVRRLRVIRAFALTRHMRRIVLGGEEIGGFAFYRSSFGPYVKLHFVGEAGAPPDPRWTGDLAAVLACAKAQRPPGRTYTVRDFDAAAGELIIDFVLHGDDGIASRWAARASPGDVVVLEERGFLAPFGFDWHILAGDHTALPAIAQILENLPVASRGQVFVSLAHPADRQLLAKPPGMRLDWLDDGEEGGCPGLIEAVRRCPVPDGARLFLWAGCEARAARALRAHARHVLGLAADQHFILNYWRRGLPEDAPHAGE
ncbi:Vibriobactin utilization protein ViuB [bacterium YEK0313]|nr:Vibriobactin utilization protein ViuB [bacterium YEK0313]